MMISVIMLTYNREQFVGEMIEDILQQTYTDFEFIIVDNGSTDNSGKIADEYAKNDERIKVIHLDKAYSIGRGRNVGVHYARGEFITYIDDDDRLESDYLEFLYSLQRDSNADIAVCGCDEFTNHTYIPQCAYNDRYILSGKEAVILLLERNMIRSGMPTKLMKRSLLEKYPFVEQCLSEDVHTAYLYFANADVVALHGKIKYHIRRHSNNNSQFTSNFEKMTPELLEEYLQVYMERSEYLKRKFPDKEQFFQYCVWSFEISMCKKIKSCHLESCRMQYNYMIKDLRNQKKQILYCRYAANEEKEYIEQMQMGE